MRKTPQELVNEFDGIYDLKSNYYPFTLYHSFELFQMVKEKTGGERKTNVSELLWNAVTLALKTGYMIGYRRAQYERRRKSATHRPGQGRA